MELIFGTVFLLPDVQDFVMAAILAVCQGCQIRDKVDGIVRGRNWAELFFSHL